MNTPTKTEIQRKIDEICETAGRDLAEASKRVLENLTPDEIKRFTAGQYPYRLAKTLLCSVSDRIEQQWAAEATLGEIKDAYANPATADMSTRLNRAAVEEQITEMWAALDQGPSSDDAEGDLEQAKRDAVECEQRLRARLAAQDRLDQAAPKLLNALDLCEATLLRLHQKHQPGCLCIKGTLDTILDAKKAALLEAP